MTETRIPPLPSEAVDFNVLHDALADGKDGKVAAAMAIAAARGDEPAPSLKGKTITQLRKIAADEKIDLPEGGHLEEIVTTIEGWRIAAMLGDPVPASPPAEDTAPPSSDDAGQ